MSQNLESCRAALKKRCSDLMSIENVVAVGVGYKVSGGNTTETLSIVCSVTEKKSEGSLDSNSVIPKSVEGVPTDVVQTGVIKAFQDPTGRFRPAPGGSSIGHIGITAGTLGCWVRRNGQPFLLSNNHVIANSNSASIGDPIVQPGPFDGGQHPQDQIATLEDFVRINFPGDDGGGGDGGGGGGGGDDDGGGGGGGGCGSVFGAGSSSSGSSGSAGISPQMTDNLVDAAIGRPLSQDIIQNDILDIGSIQGIGEAELGTALQKFGRTTRFTTGSVLQTDVTVNVSYGDGLVATFTDQIMAGAMSQGGDSGSAVLNNDKNIVGLLFAGSDTTTIINRIQHVFSSLNLTL